MPAIDTNPIQELIEYIKESVTASLQAGSADEFASVEQQFSQLDAACRELQQALWAQEAREAIRHLESDEPLTATDLEVIRVFLISDADRYLAVENNYHDWLNELQRLLDEISKRAFNLSRESVGDLRGFVKDAVRLVPDIRNYLEERVRIEKCKNALDSLDSTSRTLLARVLKDDLSSPNR